SGKALDASKTALQLERFVEKPDAETARSYVASGDYLWNSGIFMLRASAWLSLLKQFRQDIYDACQEAYARGKKDNDFLRVDKAAFAACPPDSIDYAVMEKLAGSGKQAVVVPFAAQWSDVGAWDSLWQVA